MDTKVIVEKALRGEDFTKDLESLTEEQRSAVHLEIRKSAEEAAKEELRKLTGLQKAAKAVEEKSKEKESANFERFKEDQVNIAKSKFFSDPNFPLKDDQKESLMAEYTKNNSGAVDASLIFNDLKRSYAMLFSDELISSRAKLSQMEKDAVKFTAGGANASGGMGGPENDKFSREAKELYQEWQKAGFKGAKHSLEAAQKMIESGPGWKMRNLS